MPNVTMIGQRGGYRSPSIIAKLVKFMGFVPIGAMVFTDHAVTVTFGMA